MKARHLLLPLLMGLVFVGALGGQVPPPQSQASPAEASPPREQARQDAFAALMTGRFDRGLALLGAAPLNADATAQAARTIVAGYLPGRQAYDAERQAELDRAERRVRLGLEAWGYREKLSQDNLREALQKHVEAIGDAVAAIDKKIDVAAAAQPAQTLADVRASLDKARAELAAARQRVGADHEAWGGLFRTAAEGLDQRLGEMEKVWAPTRLPEGWRTLRTAMEKIQDSMVDLGVLVAREPLTAALAHAREAKALNGPEKEFVALDWVRDLLRQGQARGEELMRQGRWNDALVIFGGGLAELDRDNEQYDLTVRKISQHVRVLSLYGNPKAPASGPATATAPAASEPEEPDDDEPRWREVVAGIDANMVRAAITEVDQNYVTDPKYREMAVAGLSAIKVLVESAADIDQTFPCLRDAAACKAFLARLDEQIQQVRSGEPAVDHMAVKQALNRALAFNDETVALPVEVLSMEFAEAAAGALDEFSNVIWPHARADFEKRTRGSFFGIGIQIRKEIGQPLEVVTPLADTPAFRAGLLAGDQILQVDGKDTETITVDRAVKLITGPKNTKVTLTLRRPGTAKPFDVVVERDEIHIETVKGWRRLEGGGWDYLLDPDQHIGYVRVTQFTADTVPGLVAALASLGPDCQALVLDLRFNPGGLLDSAILMADEFLRRGLIVKTAGRVATRAASWRASEKGNYQDRPLVVLVNEYSASAAEIVSGALKDWGRATIVGTRSYGKGSVQRLIPLRDGKAELKLTTAHYYLPQGRCLHRVKGAKDWGVDPDVAVPVTVRQTNRWSELRQETDLLKAVEPAHQARLLAQQLAEDIQLQTALLVAKLDVLRGAGQAVARGEGP